MSAHGISPAWITKGQFSFGDNWTFNPEKLKVIFANCDIAFLGDVNPTINLSLICEIIEPPPNTTINIGALCDIDFLGDLNPILNLAASCSTTFLGDVNPSNDLSDVFVVVTASGP